MGASDGSKMLNCMVKHYEPFIGYKEANITVSDLRTMKSEVDARIAELTAEVASITSQKEAQAKMWAADLDTADKLRNEVDSLRDALNDIQARVASGYFVDANHLGDIARNALKDGV